MKCCVFLFVAVIGICCARLARRHHIPRNETSIRYQTRQNTNTITIPIMIHFDKALTDKLSKDKKHSLHFKRRRLTRNVLREVEALFFKPNLKQKIKLRLINVKIIKDNIKMVKTTENASEYLRTYCQWQCEKKRYKRRWFYSVLFTGLDLYYLNGKGEEVRKTTARSYRQGVCSNRHSCAILEWRPKNLAYVLAHELAHSLGMTHDGPPHNNCQPRGFIMDANYNPNQPARNWSTCSRRTLTQFMKSDKATCLR